MPLGVLMLRLVVCSDHQQCSTGLLAMEVFRRRQAEVDVRSSAIPAADCDSVGGNLALFGARKTSPRLPPLVAPRR